VSSALHVKFIEMACLLFQRLRAALRASLIALLFPACLAGIWAISSRYEWLPPQILPAPGLAWDSFTGMLRSGELMQHAGISLLRVAEGFALGTAIGMALGIAMGLSETADDYIRPFFLAVAQVPPLGWVPPLMLLLGIGEALKITVITKAALIPVAINMASGLKEVPARYAEVGRVFMFSRAQYLARIALPASIPRVFSGIRFGLTHAWLALLGVELLASSEGLGYLLVWSRQMFWIDVMIVAMIAIAITGYLMDAGLARLERNLQRFRLGEAPNAR
jgi:sulfonate transport system permease protein